MTKKKARKMTRAEVVEARRRGSQPVAGARKKVAVKRDPNIRPRGDYFSAARGAEWGGSVDPKDVMNLFSEYIQGRKRRPPELDLTMIDPGSNFLINMYSEISAWPEKVLHDFISDVTGDAPDRRFRDHASMLGTVKAILHDAFDKDPPKKEDLLHHSHHWKMWPHVVYPDSKKAQRRSARAEKQSEKEKEMADKKATKKKTASKKKVAKTAAKKKVSKVRASAAKKSAKKTSKKRTAAKKTSKKSGGTRLPKLTLDSRLTKKVEKTKEGRGAWDEFLAAMPKSKITLDKLIEQMGKKLDLGEDRVRSIVGSLRRRGYVESSEQ